MKVKELISILNTFEQESDIWVIYDSFFAQEPDFKRATEKQCENCMDEVKTGDYIHET